MKIHLCQINLYIIIILMNRKNIIKIVILNLERTCSLILDKFSN